MTTQIQAPGCIDTILVFEEKGVVQHCFCTESEGIAQMKRAKETASGASMFTTDDRMGVELMLSASPDLRNRIDAAKTKLRNDITIRDALDRHGVPVDRETRIPVYKAIQELRSTLLLHVS